MIKETVVRNGNLRAEFFRNIWMVEKVRKNFDEDEIELFRKVYSEAKEDGEFDIDLFEEQLNAGEVDLSDIEPEAKIEIIKSNHIDIDDEGDII